ncbi:MAG: hypothetical protein M3412_10040 [Chloroflexota bacterium]|jgi:hypothetical protein|nr:hypothetical protein [Chloroflexota bacterium]
MGAESEGHRIRVPGARIASSIEHFHYETGTLQETQQRCRRQHITYSTKPIIERATLGVGELLAQYYFCADISAARLEDAERFGNRSFLFRRKVQDTVRNCRVGDLIVYRHFVDWRLVDLDSAEASCVRVRPGKPHHVITDIDRMDSAIGAYGLRCDQRIQPRAGAKLDDHVSAG